MNNQVIYPKKPKVGDIVICIDDDSQDEDFGMSGIVFKGRNDLSVDKEFRISNVPWDSDRNVPTNKDKTWTPDEYKMVRWGWYQVWLEEINLPVFLHNFKPKN